jgi:arylsulfatase A-like enzyme
VSRSGRLIVAALAISASASPDSRWPAGAATESAQRPNILVIVTDDQRVDQMVVMDKTRKWFRREGVHFPRALVTTPLCCPSRGSIFTGMYVHNHLIRGNRDSSRLDQRSTVQRYLNEAGYRAAIVGKYFNDWDLRNDPPHFDRWAIFRSGYRNKPFNINGRLRDVPQYTTDFIRDRAARFLRSSERSDAAPWLLFVTPNAPHGPSRSAARYEDARVPNVRSNPAVREKDRTDKPLGVQRESLNPERRSRLWLRQLRTLLSVDDMVGSLMRQLSELGERRRTLALFLSDNGFLLGEHGVENKRWPYTESVTVPLFARWPGRLRAGTVDSRMVSNVDIVPTILDAAGVSPDPDYPLDGRSLLDAWTRDRLLLEYFIDPSGMRVPAWASTRGLTYQYVEYYDQATGEITFREYYDLVNDPWQLVNLYGDSDRLNDPPPETSSGLSARLARDLRCEGTTGASACP